MQTMIPHNPDTNTNETIHVANWLLHNEHIDLEADYAVAREESNEVRPGDATIEAMDGLITQHIFAALDTVPGLNINREGYFDQGYSDENIYSDNPAMRFVLPMIGDALNKVDFKEVARLVIRELEHQAAAV